MPASAKVAPSSVFSTSTGIQSTSSPVLTKSPDRSRGADRPARGDRTGDRASRGIGRAVAVPDVGTVRPVSTGGSGARCSAFFACSIEQTLNFRLVDRSFRNANQLTVVGHPVVLAL